MKRLLVASNVVLAALCLWLLGWLPVANVAAVGSTEASDSSPSLTIVAIGDSITAGTASPYSFTHFLPIWKDVAVLNRGVPSDTTAKMLARMPGALSSGGEMALIFGGTNDVYYRVAPAETRANLREMVKLTREAGMRAVLVGPLPRNDVRTADLQGIREDIHRYAKSVEVAFIDPWPAFDDPRHPGWIRPNLTSDGVHPNELGAALLATQIARGLGWPDSVSIP